VNTADVPCRCEHCQRARSHRATSTTDGSGSLPPDDPGPSPTPFAVIVTTTEDIPAGYQLWVRCESWGELAVDSRPQHHGATWTPGRYNGLTVEVAP